MSRQTGVLAAAALALMLGGASLVNHFRTHQHLGRPGIKAVAFPTGGKMDFDLPERVAGFTSETMPQSELVTNLLPKDTSFAQRIYRAPDGFWAQANIILMGTDRTSIHKPEYCLHGQGLDVLEKSVVSLSIALPRPHDLTVAKWVVSNPQQGWRGIYVFWFVADGEQTASHWQRIWWLARDLIHTGVLQRWAYVNYLAPCEPGQEGAAFERLKRLIGASVPEFQEPSRFPTDPAGAGERSD
jgi:hypothetical protein